MERQKPREGDIHEIVSVGGHQFVIRYGYYSEVDRLETEPIPIYPCFLTTPHFTEEGYPLITRIQDACEYYSTGEERGDGWCADCMHCNITHQQIGVCRCKERQKPINV